MKHIAAALALAGLLLGGFFVIFHRVERLRQQKLPSTIGQIESERGDAHWQEYSRKTIYSGTLDIPEWAGWTTRAHTMDPDIRVTLTGEFQSSEPVTFVVIDATNFSRMQQGYPPIIQYHIRTGQAVDVAYPEPGAFFGFVRDPAPTGPARMPTSLGDLLAQLAGNLLAENRAPVRVTAELIGIAKCLCTDDEAAHLKAQASRSISDK